MCRNGLGVQALDWCVGCLNLSGLAYYTCIFMLYCRNFSIFANPITYKIVFRMKQNNKQQLIFEAFDTLKDSWDENSNAIKKCIVKMYDIDESLSLDMWLYILRHNESAIEDDSYSMMGDIISDIVSYEDKKAQSLSRQICNNSELCNYIFGLNTEMSDDEGSLISFLLLSNNLGKINEVFSMISENPSAKIGNAISESLDYIDCLDEDEFNKNLSRSTIEWLENFVMSIPDKKQRAVASIALLSLDD